MKNRLREQVLRGEKALGTFYELGGAAAAECLAIAGLDFFVVDTEHGPYDVESALVAVAAAERRGCTPLVRVKDITRPSILKMLDIGAKGLIVPCVETVEEVERLVEYAKYHPLGRRGYAPTRAGDFGFADFAQDVDAYFALANRETLLIPQCETRGALEYIQEIAALPGVDGVFIGPYDLSVALGRPAQMEHPDLLAAIAHVLEVCKRQQKISMIYAGGPAAAAAFLRQGFDCVACGMDVILLTQAARDMAAQVRSALGE